MVREIQKFMVSIKAFITDGDKLLMLKENLHKQYWELPGGRIDVGEEFMADKDILRRELHEELGPQLHYTLERPVATWSRHFPPTSDEFIFFVGFSCLYTSGQITLSHEHAEYRWVSKEESLKLPLAEGYDRALDQFWKNR